MQIQHIPVLIFAQSGRFLAQSATQAGYTVWVADCYGDTDSLSAAERWQSLPPFAELTHESIFTALSELTQGEQCLLVCGSGIECCYGMLFPLPANIQLIGNSPDSIQHIKTPALFFDLLSQLSFAYPDTLLKAPSDNLTWLKKRASGLGGTHIEYASANTDEISNDYYYQRFISGRSGSCLFLADGNNAQLLSINQQHLANNQAPFLLSRIESAWSLSALHKHYLNIVVNQLTAATSLVGLNSLDFIISDENKLLILEINPRPSTSAELIENSGDLFQHHFKACRGQLPNPKKRLIKTKTSLFYHYASTDCIIPEDMTWPTECNDLPCGGTAIKKSEPICTSQAKFSEHKSAMELHLIIEQKILQQLNTTQ